MSEPVFTTRSIAASRPAGSSRPEARNALEPDLMEALAAELEQADAEAEVRCIVIAGSNDVFASGGGLQPPTAQPGDDRGAPRRPPSGSGSTAISKPTVAAVSGWALGSGCELALACDMCVAAEKSQFGQPEVTLGVIPGGGGGQRLTRVIGKQRAMELVLTGRRFSAEQAFAWGLVNRVTPSAAWLQAARDLARRGRRAGADRHPARQAGDPRRRARCRSRRRSRPSASCSTRRWRPRTGSRAQCLRRGQAAGVRGPLSRARLRHPGRARRRPDRGSGSSSGSPGGAGPGSRPSAAR